MRRAATPAEARAAGEAPRRAPGNAGRNWPELSAAPPRMRLSFRMAGLRSPGGASRGSWIPRLAGIGVVVLLACAGTAVYLAHARTARGSGTRSHPSTTPSVQARVLSTQPAGIADPGPPGRGGTAAAPELLLASGTGLRFSPASQTRPPPGFPEWTVDQMQDGGYTII